MLEVLDWGVGWEESVPHEEDEVHDGTESDCSAVASELGVFSRLEVEVEAQGDQIGNLAGFGFG